MKILRWTIHDLNYLPDDGTRYEIIDGELHMAKAPNWQHQSVCSKLSQFLENWCDQTQAGMSLPGPGIIFTDDNAVIPDVIWMSLQRAKAVLQEDGKLHSCPELVIEVLSQGSENSHRDREIKLKLYSRRGAEEYWIVDWSQRTVEIYWRQETVLALQKTLKETDVLQSPLLLGFSCQVSQLFTSVLR